MLILVTVVSIQSVSGQGGVPAPMGSQCGGSDEVKDQYGKCVLTDSGREKSCQYIYGPYSHYDKSKNECTPREYCQAHYGLNYHYDSSQRLCIDGSNTRFNQYGGYTSWEKYCQANYGTNYHYRASDNKCVKSSGQCASPYISISATRWPNVMISVDGAIYTQRSLTVTVSPGTHQVTIIGYGYNDENVGYWGPRSGYVDYCKPWKITIS